MRPIADSSESRDLGGMVGNGGPAAGQGWVAALRVEKLGRDGLVDPPQGRRLQRVSAGIDEWICNVIEHGVAQRRYFQRINVPGLDDHNGELVRVTRQKFVSITSPVQTELLAIVRFGPGVPSGPTRSTPVPGLTTYDEAPVHQVGLRLPRCRRRTKRKSLRAKGAARRDTK